ncbi:MAG: hypothetical protein ABI863_02895 [Ginsengibacter sp.]
MKTKLLRGHSFIGKSLFIVSCAILGSAIITACDAQSVVGKWKRTGTKIFLADKATGKQMPASTQMQQQYDQAIAARGYSEMLELKSDHTYVITVSTAGNATPMIHNGNYSLSGKDLDMKIPLVNNQKTAITIQSLDGSTMVWDMVFMGKLTEVIYTKM